MGYVSNRHNKLMDFHVQHIGWGNVSVVDSLAFLGYKFYFVDMYVESPQHYFVDICMYVYVDVCRESTALHCDMSRLLVCDRQKNSVPLLFFDQAWFPHGQKYL